MCQKCWIPGCILAVFSLSGTGTYAAEGERDADHAIPEPSSRGSAEDQLELSQTGLDAFALNVYGLSYHRDRELARRRNLDNETNAGLGVRFDWPEDIRGNFYAEAGAYRDSGRNWAKFAGLGYRLRLGTSWKVGGALFAMQSKTYNKGNAFVGMVPVVTWDLGRVELNALYFPRFGHRNQVDALGFYLSFPIGGLAR